MNTEFYTSEQIEEIAHYLRSARPNWNKVSDELFRREKFSKRKIYSLGVLLGEAAECYVATVLFDYFKQQPYLESITFPKTIRRGKYEFYNSPTPRARAKNNQNLMCDVAEYDQLIQIEAYVPLVMEVKLTHTPEELMISNFVLKALKRTLLDTYFDPILALYQHALVSYAVVLPSDQVGPALETSSLADSGGYIMEMYGCYEEITRDIVSRLGKTFLKKKS